MEATKKISESTIEVTKTTVENISKEAIEQEVKQIAQNNIDLQKAIDYNNEKLEKLNSYLDILK